MKEIMVTSHTLKGMLLNLAVSEAAALAAQLEQRASGRAEGPFKEALATFEQEVQGLLPELETCMTEVGP